MKPKVSMIAVIDEHRALGKDNKLLWDIPEDLERFRRITKGHVVVMGRKTYESIGRLLPNRVNIIITRDIKVYLQSHPELVSGSEFENRCRNEFGMTTIGFVFNSLDEALKKAKEVEKEEIFIIGGGQIYSEAIKYADKLYLTIVEGKHEADTFFPDYSEFKKKVFEQEGQSNGVKYRFVDLERQ